MESKKKTYLTPRTTWVWMGMDKRIAQGITAPVQTPTTTTSYEVEEGCVKGEANDFGDPLPRLKNIWEDEW